MNSTQADAQLQLRRWVLEVGRNLSEETLTDTTPLFEARHLTSLNVPELLLKLEELRGGRALNLATLKPGDLQNLQAIYRRFLDPIEAES
jgi:hypothetical protein